jgi:Glycosyltransferase family 10 (fucosyltransferase) C-term
MNFLPSSARRLVREPIRRKRPKASPSRSCTPRGWITAVAVSLSLLLLMEWRLWLFSRQGYQEGNVPARQRVSLLLRNMGKDDPVVRSSQRPTTEPVHRNEYRQWEPCTPLRTEQDDPLIYEWCHDATNTFLFYNPSSFPRYICRNLRLAAQETRNVSTGDCPPGSTRLFPAADENDAADGEADVTRADPVALHFNEHAAPHELFPECDVPCWHDGGPRGNNDVRTVDAIDGSGWKVIFSMEGPQYYGELNVDPSKWRENQFWATTSYQSEIPLPYYSKAEYNIWHTNFVPFDTGIKGAVFLARNCASLNQRETKVRDLIAASFRVDALSACLHNADPPPQIGRDLNDKVRVMKQYLFYLAFENQCVDDYITEKLWGPMEAGTIPVYFGAPNVKDHVPNHSLIHADDFPTTQELAQYLEKVAHDRDLYESYHTWRKEPPPPHFRAHYDMTDTHSTCRMCRWAYARMHGRGWNHTAQVLRPLLGNVGSRAACLANESPLVQHPFVEAWKNAQGQAVAVSSLTSAAKSSSGNGCRTPLQDGNRVIAIDDGTWRRTAYSRDGFVDFTLETKTGAVPRHLQESPLRLQLQTLVQAPITFRKVRDGVWHLQSDVTRYTVLVASSVRTDENLVKQGSAKSLLEIEVSAPMRLRILVEDVDSFHQGADQVESYFGKLAADDFFTPIQVSVLVPDGGV